MGTLASRLAKIETSINGVAPPRAWVDLAADSEGVFRTIAPIDAWDLSPPFVEHLGTPVGLVADEVKEWAATHKPGVSILLRRRGQAWHGGIEFIGPPSDWEPDHLLNHCLAMADAFKETSP